MSETDVAAARARFAISASRARLAANSVSVAFCGTAVYVAAVLRDAGAGVVLMAICCARAGLASGAFLLLFAAYSATSLSTSAADIAHVPLTFLASIDPVVMRRTTVRVLTPARNAASSAV